MGGDLNGQAHRPLKTSSSRPGSWPTSLSMFRPGTNSKPHSGLARPKPPQSSLHSTTTNQPRPSPGLGLNPQSGLYLASSPDQQLDLRLGPSPSLDPETPPKPASESERGLEPALGSNTRPRTQARTQDQAGDQTDLDCAAAPRPMPAPEPIPRLDPAIPRPTRVRSWPLLVLAAPALVAIWSGWVGLGHLTGFGVVHPLPGIWDQLAINTAITLPIGVETYAAYALRAWLSPLPQPGRAGSRNGPPSAPYSWAPRARSLIT